ncbi:MAG: T9SS type A sorting domain-containing protein, partial [Crocinitomicaceae bacterium]|nr:T9SS type A sorting domain-containing protein [Crocinitomicaceae bacterium]
QGVQQPYEIAVTTGVNKTTINLELSVYPNPTTDYLTLKVEDNTELNYQIYDNHGKVIANKKVTATTSTINLESLPKATYFLNVVNNSQVLKTFKIIKN